MLRYKEIKNMLLQEIASFSPGERLPSRPALCKKLDTTRATLDKAIRELAKEGYLSSKNGSGTYLVGLQGNHTPLSKNWGIIVPNVMDAVYPGLVRGAENVAQKYGINTILCNSDNDPDKQEQYIKRLLLSGVTGIIIVPIVSNSIRENFKLYNQLADTKTPIVFCNRSVDGINVPVVTSNDFYGGYIATKHLIENGYRRIAYIAGPKYKTSIERCQGYISALIENGIEVERSRIVFAKENTEKSNFGYEGLDVLLEQKNEINGIFCFNDRIAQGCYRSIQERGLRISEDIGLIAYDNTDICDILEPKLTSVSYKNLEIGEKAAELLWKMNRNEYTPDFEYYLFQPGIVTRNSCLGKQKLQHERDSHE